jgi:multiple sugar transport system ATP-binding protein
VIHSEILGSDSFVYLDIGSGEPLVVRETGVSRHQPGEMLGVSPVDSRIHRFDESGRALERTPLRGAA